MFDLDAFGRENRARCEAKNGFNHKLESWNASGWMTATLGELGEAANIVKKLNRFRDGINGNKETEAELRDKLLREIGDTAVYLDLFCQRMGFTLGEAMRQTFDAKSREIGYHPKGDGA